MWDWQGGEIVENGPVPLFDDVDDFDFAISKYRRLGRIVSKRVVGNEVVSDRLFTVEKIIGRRELKPRVIEY